MEAELRELRASKSRTKESSSSRREDTVARMEAELRELREAKSRKSEASSSRMDTVARMEAELRELREAKSRKSEASSSRMDTVARMEAELRELRDAKSKRSEASSSRPDTLARMEAELRELRASKSRKRTLDTFDVLESSGERPRSPSFGRDSESTTAFVSRMEDRLAPTLSTRGSVPSETINRLEAERRRLEAELAMDTRDLHTELKFEREKAKRRKGIDICFLVDCTGSMASWITEVKDNVKAIARASERFCNEGIVRVGFCGYRDIGDNEQYVNVNFTEINQLHEFESRVGQIKAGGGGDTPEDIVGGLRQVLALDWYGSTRVVIHIADAPCHGEEYHDCRDDYPNGDPSGTRPEELLERLRDKRTHYFFIEITQDTRTMTRKFQSVFNTDYASFQVRALGDNPNQLLPEVIESVKSSVRRASVVSSSPRGGLGLFDDF